MDGNASSVLAFNLASEQLPSSQSHVLLGNATFGLPGNPTCPTTLATFQNARLGYIQPSIQRALALEHVDGCYAAAFLTSAAGAGSCQLLSQGYRCQEAPICWARKQIQSPRIWESKFHDFLAASKGRHHNHASWVCVALFWPETNVTCRYHREHAHADFVAGACFNESYMLFRIRPRDLCPWISSYTRRLKIN